MLKLIESFFEPIVSKLGNEVAESINNKESKLKSNVNLFIIAGVTLVIILIIMLVLFNSFKKVSSKEDKAIRELISKYQKSYVNAVNNYEDLGLDNLNENLVYGGKLYNQHEEHVKRYYQKGIKQELVSENVKYIYQNRYNEYDVIVKYDIKINHPLEGIRKDTFVSKYSIIKARGKYLIENMEQIV